MGLVSGPKTGKYSKKNKKHPLQQLGNAWQSHGDATIMPWDGRTAGQRARLKKAMPAQGSPGVVPYRWHEAGFNMYFILHYIISFSDMVACKTAQVFKSESDVDCLEVSGHLYNVLNHYIITLLNLNNLKK